MLKKLSIKTNFVLIGIIVGLFVGVSIRQALGDSTDTSGTARADNLTVNMAANAENGLAVANGNLLVPNGNIGIGTTTPTVKLDVVGDIKTTGSIKSNNLCIGATCINENQLKALLAVGGTGTDGTGGTVIPETGTGTDGTGRTITPETGTTYTLTVFRTGTATRNGTVMATDANDIFCGPTQSTCSHSYASGSSVNLTANPETGYIFKGWLDGSGYPPATCSGTNTVCSVTMSQDRFVTAIFFAQPVVWSISGTTLSWDSIVKTCQYRVFPGAWMDLSPLLNGTLSLLGKGFSVGTTYTINLRCVISSDSSGYEPWTSVIYTPTE